MSASSLKTWQKIIGYLLIAAAYLFGLYGASLAYASDHDMQSKYQALYNNAPGFATYQAACSSCHIAYPAPFLPAASWQKIMATLPTHFGIDASLNPNVQQSISQFLQSHAADKYLLSKLNKWLRDLNEPATIRLTQTPYFIHKHRERTYRNFSHAEQVFNNPGVKSFSNCSACHLYANKDDFKEHNIQIPGYGKWEED